VWRLKEGRKRNEHQREIDASPIKTSAYRDARIIARNALTSAALEAVPRRARRRDEDKADRRGLSRRPMKGRSRSRLLRSSAQARAAAGSKRDGGLKQGEGSVH